MSFFKKINGFLFSDTGYFLTIAFLLLAISISPQIKRQFDTPQNQVFSGLEFYSDDYSIYVSNIFQGQRGRWTLLDKHTSEPHQGTIIHDEYLLWGKYTSFFHVDPITSYHLARFTFGFLLLIMVWLFLQEIWPSKIGDEGINFSKEFTPQKNFVPSPPTNRLDSANRIRHRLAFFLICFSTGFIIIKNSPTGLNFDFHMSWLTEMDVFYRFVALPHYLLGNIFFLGALINFLKYLKDSLLSNLIFGAVCSLFLALIHPVALVSLLALFSIYIFFSTIIKIFSPRNFLLARRSLGEGGILKFPACPAGRFNSLILSKEVIFFLSCLLFSAPIVLYYRQQFLVIPWNHMANWEGVTQYYVPFLEFALAIGPTFFLGIVGFFAMLRPDLNQENSMRRSGLNLSLKTSLLLFSWILSFFLLVYFSYPFLHISQVRFMQVFFWIPFAILAAEGIVFLAKLSRRLSLIALTSLIALILLNALPYYYASIRLKYNFFTDFSPLVYPFKDTVAGYNFLRDHTNPDDVVIAAFLSGTQIPYFSNNTVYAGHLWATLERSKKDPLLYNFMSNKMTNEEAKEFFKANRITYYFNGWQEQSYGFDPNHYPFLKEVFKNKQVTIYKVD